LLKSAVDSIRFSIAGVLVTVRWSVLPWNWYVFTNKQNSGLQIKYAQIYANRKFW